MCQVVCLLKYCLIKWHFSCYNSNKFVPWLEWLTTDYRDAKEEMQYPKSNKSYVIVYVHATRCTSNVNEMAGVCVFACQLSEQDDFGTRTQLAAGSCQVTAQCRTKNKRIILPIASFPFMQPTGPLNKRIRIRIASSRDGGALPYAIWLWQSSADFHHAATDSFPSPVPLQIVLLLLWFLLLPNPWTINLFLDYTAA